MFITVLGLLAATLTTGASLPQVVVVLRSHDTKSLSLLTYVMFSIGCTLWTIYGFLLASLPIILANIISTFLTTWLLLLKTRDLLGAHKK